jgi:hypothetical protein
MYNKLISRNKTMIYLGTGITHNLWDSDRHFLQSMLKYSPFKNFILTCGFELNNTELNTYKNCKFTYINNDKILTKAGPDWPLPNGRNNYLTLQIGEFTQFIDYINDDDIVIFSDNDTTMQRSPTKEEIELFENIEENVFLMKLEGWPSSNKVDYIKKSLRLSVSIHEVENEFNISIQDEKLIHCAGFIAARKSSYKKLFSIYLNHIAFMKKHLRHHAATELVINIICNSGDLRIQGIDGSVADAHWYKGTTTKLINNQYVNNGKLVLFAHRKSNILSY